MTIVLQTPEMLHMFLELKVKKNGLKPKQVFFFNVKMSQILWFLSAAILLPAPSSCSDPDFPPKSEQAALNVQSREEAAGLLNNVLR